MATRTAFGLVILTGGLLVCGGVRVARGGEASEVRKNAKRVTSYIALCETVSRVGIQVGGMLDHHPYDKAMATYAREIGRLHVRFFNKLTPPAGAEGVHKRFTQSVLGFALAADAHYRADYAEARKQRKEAIDAFLRALGELRRLVRKGVIPGYVPAASGRK